MRGEAGAAGVRAQSHVHQAYIPESDPTGGHAAALFLRLRTATLMLVQFHAPSHNGVAGVDARRLVEVVHRLGTGRNLVPSMVAMHVQLILYRTTWAATHSAARSTASGAPGGSLEIARSHAEQVMLLALMFDIAVRLDQNTAAKVVLGQKLIRQLATLLTARWTASGSLGKNGQNVPYLVEARQVTLTSESAFRILRWPSVASHAWVLRS